MNTKPMIKTNALTTPVNAPLLSATFAGLALCSVSTLAQAAETPLAPQPAYTLKIVTHGENANASHNMTEKGRQENRRADVSMRTTVQKGTRIETTQTTEK